MTESRVVAVLSGGGVKAIAHLGALRALAEAGIHPTRYIGTSMGAAVAAALAAGLTPDELEARLMTIRRRDVARISPVALAKGLYATAILRPEPLRETLEQVVPARRFADLVHPLTVTAADLNTGDLVQFGAGGEDVPLIDALYASCALPLLYPPARIGGRRLADGGLRGVVALEVARGLPADLVVAVDVGPGFDMAARTRRRGPPPAVRVHNEAQWVLMADATRLQVALWRATPGLPPLLYIRPRVRHGATFDLTQAGYYLQEGYRAARDALSS
jgi:NTE family protein